MESANALAIMPQPGEWTQMKEVAVMALKSGLLPSSVKTPETATIIALTGWELGLKPMVAFSHIHVVNGKTGCSAELMLAKIYTDHQGAVIEFKQSDEKVCVIQARRANETKLQEFKFTIEEAHKARLTEKDVWKNYPTDMLRARAITRLKRAKFPEILMGLDHTPEELEGIKDVTPKTQEREVQSEPPAQSNVSQIKTIKNFAPASKEDAEQQAAEINARLDAEAAQKFSEGNQVQVPPHEETPKKPTRQEIGNEIVSLAKELGIKGKDALDAKVLELTKKSIPQLTETELVDLRDVLKIQLAKAAN